MARTRVFEVDQAVEVAISLFWEKGYDKTSLTDLTQAMGITPPSFYYAFESKEGLVKLALKRYLDTRIAHTEEALHSEPDARSAVELMLRRMATLYTEASHPPGCLAASLAFSGMDLSDATRKEFRSFSKGRRARLVARLEQAIGDGQLPPATNAEDLARYFVTVGWGMAHDARSGAGRSDLYKTVAQAMLVWPSS